MKVSKMFVREVAAILAVVGFLSVGTQQAHAQTSFTYPPFPTSIGTGLQVNGNASIVTPETGSNYLQLTPNSGSQVGSAWYTNPAATAPAPLSLVNGFTSTFTFQFTNQNTPSTGGSINGWNGTGGADGIAFVVQNGCFTYNDSNYCGSSALAQNTGAGGEIGLTGLTNSVAVQFDTWCNTGTGYFDTCATKDPYSSADQITVESCGANANTVNHDAGCSFGTVDLSVLATPIYLADGAVHTAQISYAPPAVAGTCTVTSALGSAGCGSLTVILDGQTVLIVPFNLAYLSLDANDDAYVGFTGATGGAWETQDILNWSFMAGVSSVVTQPFPIPEGSGTNVNIFSNFGSSNGTGPTLTTDILYTVPKTSITPSPNAPQPLLIQTNSTFQPSTWPEYVVGTPWATSSCTVKAANGGSNLCSLYTNACYQTGTSPTLASDAYCPTVTTPDEEDYIILEDTFDWGTGKWPPTAGMTASLIAFSVPLANPSLQWAPSLPPAITNGVCPTQVSSTPSPCYLTDTLIDIFGDQTTTKGSKPKSKAWLVSAVNVAMPTTALNVTGSNCSSFGPTVWNNSACVLDFVVTPAGGFPAPTPSTANNYFQAAQPSFLEYGFLPGTPTPPAPPVAPGPLPGGDASVTNGNPVLTCSGSPTLCSATPWDTAINATLQSIFSATDGTFTLHWSAKDTAGITEKNIQLNPESGGVCPTPNGNVPVAAGSQCYTTSYFTAQVNLDSTQPSISASFSPSGSPAGTFTVGQSVYPVYTCVDPLAGTPGVASGIMNCGGISVPPSGGVCLTSTSPLTSTTALNTSAAGTFSYPVTATDCAGNMTNPALTVSYTVVQIGQTITFGPLANQVLGTAPFTVSATASSGLPVSFASLTSTYCSVSGSTVTLLNAGTCTIQATQLGNATYSAAAPVNQSFQITAPAPAADVAVFAETSDHPTHGTTMNFTPWVLDLSKPSASNVVLTITIPAPAGVISGPITGKVADVSCSLAGCSAVPPSGGSSCSVVSIGNYTSNTITCNIGTLGSVFNLKGAAAKISIPISSSTTVEGSKFAITATVTSANDPNSKNNTVVDNVTVK
jgi:hypothetical protein